MNKTLDEYMADKYYILTPKTREILTDSAFLELIELWKNEWIALQKKDE